MKYTKTDSKDNKIKLFKREEDGYVFFFIVLSGAWETDILSYNKSLPRELCKRIMPLMDDNKKIDIITLVDELLIQIGCVGNRESIRNTLLRETLGLFYVDKTNYCCHFYRLQTSVEISESLSVKGNTLLYGEEELISIQFNAQEEARKKAEEEARKKAKKYLLIVLMVFACVATVLISYKIKHTYNGNNNENVGENGKKDEYVVTLKINPEGQVSIKGIPDFPDDCMVEYAASMDPGFTLDDGKTPPNSIKYPISILPYLTRSCNVAVRVWEHDEPRSPWLYANYNLEYYIDSLWQDYSKLSYDVDRRLDTPTDIAMSRLFDREISYCNIRYNQTVIEKQSVPEVAQFVDIRPMSIDSVEYISDNIPSFITDIDSFPKIQVVYCHPMK